MRIYWLLAAIILLTYSIYYGARYAILPAPPTQLGVETMALTSELQIGTSEDVKSLWSTVPGSTLSFYINPQIQDRTATIGNEYATALNIGDNQSVKFLIALDAGRSNMMAPVIFEVYTSGNSLPEVIDIPGIYLQRWSCVVIVKQGRKFNIYVNGKLSASRICDSMPELDNTKSLRIGDSKKRLGGSIALVNLAPYAMQLDDVRSYVNETMGTDGKPYLSSDLPALPVFSLDSLSNLFICPGGNCSSPKSTGPIDQWNSEYA
jgi:hypothetical protein